MAFITCRPVTLSTLFIGDDRHEASSADDALLHDSPDIRWFEGMSEFAPISGTQEDWMKVCALAVMIAMATPAVAQDAPPASAAGAANPAPASTVDSASLPRCSAKVTDRCIQGGGRNSRHASKKKSKPHKAAQAAT